jgi:hypothetical protein
MPAVIACDFGELASRCAQLWEIDVFGSHGVLNTAPVGRAAVLGGEPDPFAHRQRINPICVS